MGGSGTHEQRSTVVRLGRTAWALLGIVGVLIVTWLVVSQLALVVVPVLLALFVAAALAPVANLATSSSPW